MKDRESGLPSIASIPNLKPVVLWEFEIEKRASAG